MVNRPPTIGSVAQYELDELHRLQKIHAKRVARKLWWPGKFCFLDIRIHRTVKRIAMLTTTWLEYNQANEIRNPREPHSDGSYPSVPRPPVG